MISAFGVEHGDVVAKYDREKYGSPGRLATGSLLPGYHGAVAGQRGHKLKAAGSQLVGGVGGAAVGGPFGSIAGAGAATAIGNNQGWYKKQPKSKTKPKKRSQ